MNHVFKSELMQKDRVITEKSQEIDAQYKEKEALRKLSENEAEMACLQHNLSCGDGPSGGKKKIRR